MPLSCSPATTAAVSVRELVAVGVVVVAGVASASAQTPAATLTLSDALARARATAPALAAARVRADAAHDASQRAGRLLNPVVEVRAENWASGAPGGLPLDVFATVTQTVEFGDKRAARRGLADAVATNATVAVGLGWRDVAAGVTADYLAAVRAAEHLAALDRHAARLSDAVRILARRVDVGSAPEADLLKLRTEEARVTMDRARTLVAAMRATAALGARLDLDVSIEQLRRPDAPPLPVSDEVSGSHPELLAADGQLQAARAAARFEQARGRPDLGVNAGVKRTAGYNTGVVALTVPVPIFDTNAMARSVAAGQVRAAEFERSAVARRLRGARLAATAAATALSGKANEVAQTLVAPAHGARDAARAAFDAGALDVMRLVDAERLVIEADRVATDLAIDAVGAAIEARLSAGEEPLP